MLVPVRTTAVLVCIIVKASSHMVFECIWYLLLATQIQWNTWIFDSSCQYIRILARLNSSHLLCLSNCSAHCTICIQGCQRYPAVSDVFLYSCQQLPRVFDSIVYRNKFYCNTQFLMVFAGIQNLIWVFPHCCARVIIAIPLNTVKCSQILYGN